ncbi:DUF4369 domain-containing protein [Puia sp. P3]|uniref:DUF4369 domain-containing protein n=1 Tax=Puia sp. P3 TaxID=3423952 RepID=UPI003D668E55
MKAQAQAGHSIRLHLKPYTAGKVYLGYYYGKIKALADSAQLNASGEGVFSGKDRLPGGVYFVVSPARSILFELLIDSAQHFSIAADTASLPNSVVFTGSQENIVFQGIPVIRPKRERQSWPRQPSSPPRIAKPIPRN